MFEMATLQDLKDHAITKLQTGDPIRALKVFRLVIESEPRDFQSRLKVADCLLVMGETRLAGGVYAAVAVYDIKAGLPLQALVAIKMIAHTYPRVKELQRDLAAIYCKDSPRMGRGARAAPVDLSARVRDDIDLDYPMDTAVLLRTTAQMAATTDTLTVFPDTVPPVPLFSELGAPVFERVIDALELRRYDHDEVVFRQGQPGDCFFVVAQGMVRVEQNEASGQPAVLARLGEGSVFGEMAVLTDEPRSATVRADGGADLLRFTSAAVAAIDKDLPQIGAVLQKHATERMVRNLLSSNPFFEPFDQRQRLELLKRFEAHKVPAGTVVVRQGEEGRGLYLILHGESEVVRTEPDGRRIGLAVLGSGACFGEIALCQRCPTTASVTATRDSTIMFLPREYFDRLLEAVPALRSYYLDLASKRLDDIKRRAAT
jgi:CRP-like cAMP-binding protein